MIKLKENTPNWQSGMAKSITFIVTKDCQLACRYCYLVGKNAKERMTFDVAKKAVDYILSNEDAFREESVTWDFIGGEPFLEIDLIDAICDYIKAEMFRRSHHWFASYRFNFSTNGINYADPRVQAFIQKNITHLSIGITIDGTEKKHDLNRVYKVTERGSYRDVVRNIPLWLSQFPHGATKVTISSADLPYVRESVLHLFGLGIHEVNINCVFEDVWAEGDDALFEQQLMELADEAPTTPSARHNMLQYLIILLDDTSTSFCHYDVPVREPRPMPLDTLRKGIRFGMMQNLMIQFVYPTHDLPPEHLLAIETIDHSNIKPTAEGADVMVANGVEAAAPATGVATVLRTGMRELMATDDQLLAVLKGVPRLNVALTDLDSCGEAELAAYQEWLSRLAARIEQMYVDGLSPQLNLLTDRMMLSKMNNCGAGDTSITLAPNGKFYVCPAFYYDDATDSVGDLEHGLQLKNQQLYQLDHAPICRHCDAYQCKRCVWLSRKATREVNTPSHEQCAVAHVERNASRLLLHAIRQHGTFLPEQGDIKQIDYLDPFDIRDTWQQEN